MKSSPIAFGVIALAVGVGTGWLIVAYPKGLNPSWPIGMALLVPAMFALGGIHLLGQGFGYPKLAAASLRVIVVGFLAIGNWAAFMTARVPCRQTASFFGVPLLERYPSDAECRSQLRTIMVLVDGAVAFVFAALAWRTLRRRSRQPAE